MVSKYSQLLSEKDEDTFDFNVRDKILFLSKNICQKLNLPFIDNHYQLLEQLKFNDMPFDQLIKQLNPTADPQNIIVENKNHLYKLSITYKTEKEDGKLKKLTGTLSNILEIHTHEISYTDTHDVMINILKLLMYEKDAYTSRHCSRTEKYVLLVSQSMKTVSEYGLDPFMISKACILHDIGKIYISNEIFDKKTLLSDAEVREIQKHPYSGSELLQNSLAESNANNTEFFKLAISIIESHHERWDGSGYPLGLKGEGIPIEGRIMAICDTYDALRSMRPYRTALTHKKALEVIQEESGRQFDPFLVEHFMENEVKIHHLADLDETDYNCLSSNEEFLNWHDAYELDNNALNKQHKDVLTHIADCYKELMAGDCNLLKLNIFKPVTEAFLFHLRCEEALMVKHHYPKYKEHKDTHDEFEISMNITIDYAINNYITKVEISNIFYTIANWLSNHISEYDKEFVNFINNK